MMGHDRRRRSRADAQEAEGRDAEPPQPAARAGDARRRLLHGPRRTRPADRQRSRRRLLRELHRRQHRPEQARLRAPESAARLRQRVRARLRDRRLRVGRDLRLPPPRCPHGGATAPRDPRWRAAWPVHDAAAPAGAGRRGRGRRREPAAARRRRGRPPARSSGDDRDGGEVAEPGGGRRPAALRGVRDGPRAQGGQGPAPRARRAPVLAAGGAPGHSPRPGPRPGHPRSTPRHPARLARHRRRPDGPAARPRRDPRARGGDGRHLPARQASRPTTCTDGAPSPGAGRRRARRRCCGNGCSGRSSSASWRRSPRWRAGASGGASRRSSPASRSW